MLEKEVLIHDLNNLLTVISSTAELLKIELNNKIPSKSISKLDSLLISSQKASELIRNYKTGNGKQRRTDLKAYLTEFQKFVAALTEKHSSELPRPYGQGFLVRRGALIHRLSPGVTSRSSCGRF